MLPTTATARAPLVLVLVAYAGAASALIGGYWDDAWHTERGRDDFFIAPHIAIYAGIALAGASLTLWALLVARRQGPRAVWAHKPLVLALLSVSVTLASGPIDNLWHLAFGRDAVIWSPPHMLGIAGTLALAASLLVELASRPERWAIPLSVVAGALVIAPAAFSTVEYDTDVPQFSELWYLPVLGFAAAIAFAMVRLASPLRWAATLSARSTRSSSRAWASSFGRSTFRRRRCRSCWPQRSRWTWVRGGLGRQPSRRWRSQCFYTPLTCQCATGSVTESRSPRSTSRSGYR